MIVELSHSVLSVEALTDIVHSLYTVSKNSFNELLAHTGSQLLL